MNPQPSFEELLADPGIVGVLLRNIPVPTLVEIRALIKEAPGTNPWELLHRAAQEKSDKKLFAAIASQEEGWRALVSYGTERTRDSEPIRTQFKKAKAQENLKEMWRLAEHEAIGQAKYDPKFRASPEFAECIKQAVSTGDFAFVAKAMEAAMKPATKPAYRDVGADYRIQCFLVENWIRCGKTDLPGLLFFTDAALRQFIEFIFPRGAWANVDRTRRRLGLISGPNIVKGVSQDKNGRIVLMKTRLKPARGKDWQIAIITQLPLPNGGMWSAPKPKPPLIPPS